jgi:large subunit ribosomal protein L13
LVVKTYSAKSSDVERKWYVVDAASAPLGRMATQVATLLRGKHKPIYTPHVDTGDHVIVINADQLQLTGLKMDQKVYDRYSGYQSGRYERTAREQLALDSTEMVLSAVRGMLPKTKLGRQMITKLKVYAGSEHPHAAQNPEVFEVNA